MADDPQDPDGALVSALSTGQGSLDREELAAQVGIPSAVVEALEREGLLVTASPGRYAPEDVELLRAGRVLLDAGIPLGEVLDLARGATNALTRLADDAVDLFIRFVRDPIHGSSADEREVASRLVAAYESLLPATTTLVEEHFRRLLLARARARVEAELDEAGER